MEAFERSSDDMIMFRPARLLAVLATALPLAAQALPFVHPVFTSDMVDASAATGVLNAAAERADSNNFPNLRQLKVESAAASGATGFIRKKCA